MNSPAVNHITTPPTTKSPRAIFGIAKKHLSASPDTNQSASKVTRSLLPSSVPAALAGPTRKMPHPLNWKLSPNGTSSPSVSWARVGSTGRRPRSSTTTSMSSTSYGEDEDLSVSLATPLLRTPPASCRRQANGYHSPEVSPLTPGELSFDQLIFSNQTLRVSLTPDTCLDSDSKKKSRQANDLLKSPNDSPCLLTGERFAITPQEALDQKKEPRSPLVRGQQRFGAHYVDDEDDQEVILGEKPEGCSGEPTAGLQSLAEFLDSEPPRETDAQLTVRQQAALACQDRAGEAGRFNVAAPKKPRKSWLPKLH